MDLRLFARVLWRFRVVVVVGCVLAVALAMLSYYRIDLVRSPHLTPRTSPTYVSYTRLLVGQSGFSLGSTFSGNQTQAQNQEAAQGRFASLAVIYSSFAGSDAVTRLINQYGHVKGGTLEAAALTSTPGGNDYLPIISIAAFAPTPLGSQQLAGRASKALRTYITKQQEENGIKPAQRVQLTPLNSPGQTKLFTARKKTIPIVIFLTVLLATIGAAFVAENLRPRVRVVETPLQEADRLKAESVRAAAS